MSDITDIAPQDYPAALDISPFACRAAVRGGEAQRILLVPGREGDAPIPFALAGNSATALCRLARLDGRAIATAATLVFEASPVDAVVFEDVELASPPAFGRPSLVCRYQANWRVALAEAGSGTAMSGSRSARRSAKRLARDFPDRAVTFEFDRTSDDIVETVIRLNRRTIEAKNDSRYRLGKQKLSETKAVAREHGYHSLLRLGDEIVAGSIEYVFGASAYGIVTGYDARFAKYSPGKQIFFFTSERLAGLGCREFNLMWGDSPYKEAIGAVRAPLATIVVARGARAALSPRIWRIAAPYAARDLRSRVKRALSRP